MGTLVKKLLFATDMSKECQSAYDFAVKLAMSCHGSITLLHVIEPPPITIETQVKNLLGEDRYQQILKAREKDARSVLIGKRKESEVILSALHKFWKDAGDDKTDCFLPPDEILVKNGDVIDEIVSTAEDKQCDIIILSAHKNLFSRASVSHVIQDILKRSSIPAMLIPPADRLL